MSARFLTAASLMVLVSACSSQPGPSSLSPAQQADEAYRAGNFAAAEQGYAGVLSVNPNDPTAMLGLAEVYEATGRVSEAAQLYARVSAARSGAIRVWNDGGALQDGVTEVATRRLGEMGHGHVVQYGAPTMAAPTTYAAPVATEYWPEDPVYALDQDGVVYYADPEGTQPVQGQFYESPEAAMMATPVMAAPTTYAPAPVMAAPMTYEPAPAPVEYAPAPMTYEAAPMTAPIAADYTSAPMTYEAAPMVQPTYAPAPMTYEAAPMVEPTYAPAPMTYETAPIVEPAPVYAPAPITAPAYTPAPVALRAPSSPVSAAALTRNQPGYAVVDGNFVYVSAEDIAGATGGTVPAFGAPAPAPSMPVQPSQTYTAPRGVDVMNGIPMLNLN